jgi:hypothetical protein
MMPTYAVINGSQVENIIVAEDLETAELVSSKKCVLFENKPVDIKWTYNGTHLIGPKMYESWVLNEVTGEWEAPVAKPEDNKQYDWNEEDLVWQEVL